MSQNILSYLKSKFVLIIGFSLILSAVFYAASFMFSNLYKTDVYCYSNIFDNVHNKSVFNSFNLLIGTGNNAEIKHLTNLDDEVINQIKQVDFFEIISNQNNYFKISLVSKSNIYTDEYLSGIVYFYENSGINKDIIKLEYDKVKQKIKNKSLAVSNIDSIFSLMKTTKGVIFESNIELTKNRILDELENEKIKLVTDKGLNIINKPFAPTNSYFPNKLMFLVFGFILGFISSLFLLVMNFELKKSNNE
ncbi:MAG: LPS O-antigen subunit length determinant protein (WzzB/FepE family) [Planctomycetota bacterium]|jgi:LPS O-antigen subunit length determinant protein (WzzB/FepE family)